MSSWYQCGKEGIPGLPTSHCPVLRAWWWQHLVLFPPSAIRCVLLLTPACGSGTSMKHACDSDPSLEEEWQYEQPFLYSTPYLTFQLTGKVMTCDDDVDLCVCDICPTSHSECVWVSCCECCVIVENLLYKTDNLQMLKSIWQVAMWYCISGKLLTFLESVMIKLLFVISNRANPMWYNQAPLWHWR